MKAQVFKFSKITKSKSKREVFINSCLRAWFYKLPRKVYTFLVNGRLLFTLSVLASEEYAFFLLKITPNSEQSH